MSSAQESLERIHGDFVGPLLIEASGSYQAVKYVLTFVDDYSHYTFIYFLSRKDEAFAMFKVFKALMERKFNKKLKTLHTDRGREFISLEIKTFLDKVGIQHEKMAPYSP